MPSSPTARRSEEAIAEAWYASPVAVLASGGVESAVLIGELARTAPRVTPVYVRCGFKWETIELRHLRRYVAALNAPVVEPPHVFELPVASVYGRHWSLGHESSPDSETPDEAVFLPGRNILLLAPTALWCHLNDIPTIAIGHLARNPFPDSTDEFFALSLSAINRGLNGSLSIQRPFAHLSKSDVLRRGIDLPIHETFSCIQPVESAHCGRCNKCAERKQAFLDAGIADQTPYSGQ